MNRKVELPRMGNSLFLSVDKYCYIYMPDNKPEVVVCKNFIDGII